MNDMIIQSQKIATRIQSIIPQSTFRNIQSAITNITVPKVKINTAVIEYTNSIYEKTFQGLTTPFDVSNMIKEMFAPVLDQMEEINRTTFSVLKIAFKRISQKSFLLSDEYREVIDRMLFLEIVEKIGYPVYLECDTELQNILIEAYRKNNYNCNIDEMKQIIMDYYNEDYIDNICYGFVNENILKKERASLLIEGIMAYQFGLYGAANSLFAAQMSGMIRDIYDELSEIHKYTKAEKNEIKNFYDLGRCKDDSEKVMLVEVISEQEGGFIIWHQIAKYFLKYVFSSGEKYMEEYPKRHMICHGIQTNYNTKEMSLKLILCLDILVELALRIEKMKENNQQVVIDM